jgi:hypothetical protein
VTTEQLQGLVAVFVPLLVSVIKRENFPNTVNAIIAIVVYAVIGVLAVLVAGQPFDINNIAPSVAIFVTGGTIAYQLFWKNWGDPQITAAVNGAPKP